MFPFCQLPEQFFPPGFYRDIFSIASAARMRTTGSASKRPATRFLKRSDFFEQHRPLRRLYRSSVGRRPAVWIIFHWISWLINNIAFIYKPCNRILLFLAGQRANGKRAQPIYVSILRRPVKPLLSIRCIFDEVLVLECGLIGFFRIALDSMAIDDNKGDRFF